MLGLGFGLLALVIVPLFLIATVEFPLFRGQVNIGQLMLRLHDTAVHS